MITTKEQWRPQIAAGPVTLAPGRYRAALGGGVYQGGLDLQVVDAHSGDVLAARHFISGRPVPSGQLTVPFALRASTDVELVVAN
jgi:hypothetical protein